MTDIRGMERQKVGVLQEWILSPDTHPEITFTWFAGSALIVAREDGREIEHLHIKLNSNIDQVECHCWEWLVRNR